MAIDLSTLSPKELKALIANAESQMHEARSAQVQEVRQKIDNLLASSGLSLGDVYPGLGGKAAKGGRGGKRGAVAPKYRNPEDASQTWTGRGKRPLWFAAAIKRRGVTAESLLISPEGNPAGKKAATVRKTAKAAKKATRKAR